MIYNNDGISIIVPVYNVKPYIKECLDSLVAQTYNKIQIILVDDGSNDGSSLICDKYAEKDKRFVVIHKENGGVTSARKVGLKYATEKYVGFVDPDDWVESNMFEEMIYRMIKYNCDLLHTYKIKNIGNKEYSIKEKDQYFLLKKPAKNKDFFKSVLSADFTAVLWLNLYKREIITNCYERLPEYFINGDDYVINIDYIIHCESILFLPNAYYHYRKRENSIQNMQGVDLLFSTSKQFQYLNKLLNKNSFEKDIIQYLNCCFIRRTLFLINNTKLVKHIPVYIPDIPWDFKCKKIIICGAGSIGKEFYEYLKNYMKYDVVKWVDINFNSYAYDEKVYPLKDIFSCYYDVILIAVEKSILAEQIRNTLINMGICSNCIYWRQPISIIDTPYEN